MAQPWGPKTGWALDLEPRTSASPGAPADARNPLLPNTTAGAASLAALQALYNASARGLGGCGAAARAFAAGSCLALLDVGGRGFRALQPAIASARGRVGVALPPGASQV